MTVPPRLALPDVTLCAITSVNVEATVAALQRCLSAVDFAECLLFTDLPVDKPGIRVVPIPSLDSAEAYSLFILRELPAHIRTNHVLTVQWDGFILNSAAWRAEFLDYDYVGATWPQFQSGNRVGNGGFSLRSKRLLQACLDPSFRASHPEDLAVCRENHALLVERHGLRFAEEDVADRFAYERTRVRGPTFGFHGVFNMPDALGLDGFWDVYQSLDERSALKPDFLRLACRVLGGKGGPRRVATMLRDRWYRPQQPFAR
ncbi:MULTISPECIES: DUF5672 family protein [unclassified Sphingobium]|uniref:DUF5672 family protein n=1 Tax=unclassified Sphingobium TaxID=2611147 RepID=UPI00222475A7|nr:MULTISPECIES: DUF5672 family protein [unclassified Sphingobium]MCW2411759.1 hypothetical protein [Sphingobium sp. B8D3D]MCW2415945.1 hypothetical protein [Sphingobium sp. B8D3A]